MPHVLPPTRPEGLPDQLIVLLWADSVTMSTGHEARSAYVERFWLGLLGPSSTWLWRRLVRGLDECPSGYRVQLADTARALGLGAGTGRNSMIVRSLERTIQFGAARYDGKALEVRTHLPTLTHRQVRRLPPAVQAAHAQWRDDDLSPSAPDPGREHPSTRPATAGSPHRSPYPPAA